MRDSKEVMDEFMRNIRNMRLYQGIDIMNPETYDGDVEKVHKAYDLEKSIVAETHFIEDEIKGIPDFDDEEER